MTNAPASEIASCGAPAPPVGTYTGPLRRVETAAAGVLCDADATATLARFSDTDGSEGFEPEYDEASACARADEGIAASGKAGGLDATAFGATGATSGSGTFARLLCLTGSAGGGTPQRGL